MTAKQAIEHAINRGYTGLVYRNDTLSSLVWICGKQARIAIWSRGEWFMD